MANEPDKKNAPLPPAVHEALNTVRRQLYRVELVASLLSLAYRVFWLFFAAILLDHWVLPSGMGYSARVLCWLVLIVGIVAYAIKRLGPFVLSRIHPLYAADSIEREYPQLKNNLLNLLFLRSEQGENAHRRFVKTDSERLLQERIIQSLENQAEADLTVLSPKLAVDFGPILKRSYLLVLTFFVFGVYLALSPKSPWTSISRVLFPLSQIEAPTRVQILEVRPGNTTLFQGDTLTVSARLKNVREEEPVRLLYTTEDRQTVDFPLNMKPVGRNRFTVSKADIRQAMTWRIVCGDAVSPSFQVKVLPPLTVQIEHVTLEPPAYTGQEKRTLDAGDFVAIEGTTAEISAQTNQPAKSAVLEILSQDDAPFKRLVMERNAQGTGLSVRFPLERSEQAKTTGAAEKFRYRIGFETASGARNLHPSLYQMEVTPDAAPIVRLLEAPEDGATVPENGSVKIQLEARDPDFGLRGVAFRARWNDQPLDIPAILNTSKNLTTTYRATFTWKPGDCRLRAGDSIQWWVEAKDNRQPEGNRTRTELRRLEITAIEQPGNTRTNAGTHENPADSEETTSGETGDTPDSEEGSTPTDAGEDGTSEETPDGSESTKTPAQNDTQEETGTPAQNDSSDASQQQGEAESNSGSAEKQGSGESAGSSSEAGGESGDGSDSKDGNGSSSDGDASDGDSSDSSDGSESGNDSKNSGNSAESENSGDSNSDDSKNGDDSGEKEPEPRTEMPRTAPQAFDPLGEQAEQTEQADEKRESGETSGNQADEKTDGEPNEENSEKDADGQQSDENSRSDEEQNGDDAEKQPGEEPDSQPGDQPEAGESSGEKPRDGSDEKSGGKSGTSDEKLNADEKVGGSEESDDSQHEQTDEQKVGSETGGDAETSEGTPADNGENADSEGAEGDDAPQPGDGSQKGKSPSKQPKGTKPNGGETDGEGLQESDGSSQSKDKRDGDSGEADANSASNTPIDPQANPGEAFEQILEHQKSQASQKPNQQDTPQDSQRGENSESDPRSTSDSSSTEPAGDFDLQNGTMEQADEKSDETQQGKSSNRTGNDSQAGGDSKTHNDRMTDNSGESNSKNEKNKGGNKNGGQDDSNQQGIGRAGNNTAEKEGNPSGSGGDGPTGQKGGKGPKTDQKTGVTQEDAEGQNDSQGSGQQSSDASKGKTSQNAKSSSKKGEASAETSDDPEQNTLQSSSGGMGKQPGRTASAGPQDDPAEAENADAANLDFTRQQTLLALNHLQDVLDEGDETLLKRLGWTREQAQAFLKHWKELHQKDQKHQLTKAEQQKFEKDLRSLGLTQRTTEFQNETKLDTRQRRVRDARRLAVPESWREQVEAYSKGVSE